METHDLDPKVKEVLVWAQKTAKDPQTPTTDKNNRDEMTNALLARLIRDLELMLPKLTAIEGAIEDKKHDH